MSVAELVKMSNKYGADADYVIAGGGNTSYKDGDILYIKGSGTSLATITEDGFVRMNISKLAAMWAKDYGNDLALSEKRVLRDMMDARELGEEEKRPSVETLLHQMLPFKFVLHVHPALVNGLTCGKSGEIVCRKLLPESLFMKATKPGYILAKAAKKAVEGYFAANNKTPSAIFMQNHGVFFGADSLSEMDETVKNVMDRLKGAVKNLPDFTEVKPLDKEKLLHCSLALRSVYKKNVGSAISSYINNKEIEKITKNEKTFSEKAGLAFTPDHIVYCRHKPLYLELDCPLNEIGAKIEASFSAYGGNYGFLPKIVFIKDIGMFALGKTKKEADIARDVFLDEIKISCYSESFGGQLFMSKDDIDFILNWEVESYRQKVSLNSSAKRLNQKIALITGAAQGYGKGIAQMMAKEGANVIIADLNFEGALKTAKEIECEYGKGCAIAVKIDVSSDEEVKSAVEDVAIYYGGLDILVNNAGILKAGSLEEMDYKSFELVTKINYSAFFLCTKYCSAIMKMQHLIDPREFYDIIQINSKSGLSGSNKNFAYAGSKFGGIGLTQSFALELVPYNIKVNAICPGNFYEGPLWADPINGLFVQYLKTGKVPGAKNIEDVKRFYEAKVPMNRGCRIEDVAKAIYYIVEQSYETGQAVPVTGGQEMLK